MKVFNQRFLENARILGMIEESKPNVLKYHESWIQGSSRLRTTARIKYLKSLEDSGCDVGTKRLISGNRELWAEIDQLCSIEEAKNFMLQIAEENQIAINKKNKFIVKKIYDANRTYLNYAEGENRKITEIMMAKKIYQEIFGQQIKEIVDSSLLEGKRPTTESAALDLVRQYFKEKLRNFASDNHETRIMIVSDQPHCDRQLITIQRVVERELGKELFDLHNLVFEEIGPQLATAPQVINSEFGALITEKFLQKIERENISRKRDYRHLFFAKRFRACFQIPSSSLFCKFLLFFSENFPKYFRYYEKFSEKIAKNFLKNCKRRNLKTGSKKL